MHLWVWNCLIQRIKLKQLSKNKPLQHATFVVINIEIHVNKWNYGYKTALFNELS